MVSNWTVTLDDTSSIINYYPHGDGGVGDWTSTGWQPWFGASGGFNHEGGEDGTGTSLHITAFPGAHLDFQFYETGIALYGTANCSYEVSLDGAASTSLEPTDGQLFARDSLPEQTHSVTLTAHASNSSMFSFDRADITRSLPAGANPPKPVVYTATNATFFSYGGAWKVMSDPNGQIPSKQHPAPFYEVADAPASFAFSFQGTGVSVNGSRNWGGYTYDVMLDGHSTTYNASTMWLIGDALLFYQDGLDPHDTHTVNITPKVGSGYKFWLNSVTVFDGGASSNTTNGSIPSATASQYGIPTTSKAVSAGKSTNVGAIVGPVIGGLVVLLGLAGIAWWLLRRHRVQAAARADAQFSLFVLPPQPPPSSQAAGTLASRASEKSQNFADSGTSGLQLPMAAAVSASPTVSPPASTAALSPSVVQPAPDSPGVSQTTFTPVSASAPNPSAAVDQLIQLIAERIGQTHPGPRSNYGSEGPPPEYVRILHSSLCCSYT